MKPFGLLLLAITLAGCVTASSSAASAVPAEESTPFSAKETAESDMRNPMDHDDAITVGSMMDRGMIVDNVYHDETEGEIHFSSYFPDSYDGSTPYALFVTNPGWEGEYPQGLGNNLKEDFAYEARKYNDHMIILSTQLYDWGETSAKDALALIHHFIDHYNIDQSRIYLHGYSGGGETGSLMMGMEPELFAGVLLNSTRWDSSYEPIVKARTPLRLAVGENDTYYSSQPLIDAYNNIHAAYEKEGLSDDEIKQLLVLDIKPHEWFTEHGYSDEHDGGNAFAKDEETMQWLFSNQRQ